MREELIIKYLEQSLSPEETKAFEHLSDSDPTIIEEINQLQKIETLFSIADFKPLPPPELAAKIQTRLIPRIDIPLVIIDQEESILSLLKDIAFPLIAGLLGLSSLFFIPQNFTTRSINFLNETTLSYLTLSAACCLGLFILDKLIQKKFRSFGALLLG